MPNIAIKTELHNQFIGFSPRQIHFLCLLQQKKEGIQKITPFVSAGNAHLAKKDIKVLAAATIKVCGQEIGIFQSISYKRGKIEYIISDPVWGYIQSLRGYFRVDMDVSSKIRSKKTLLFYHMLCRFRSTGRFDQYLCNFKKWVGADAKIYRNTSFFRIRVFNPSVQEIERLSSFRFIRSSDGNFATVSPDGKRIQMTFCERGDVAQQKAAPAERKATMYELLRGIGLPSPLIEQARKRLGYDYLAYLLYAVKVEKSDGGVGEWKNLFINRIQQSLRLTCPSGGRKRKKQRKTGSLSRKKRGLLPIGSQKASSVYIAPKDLIISYAKPSKIIHLGGCSPETTQRTAEK